MAIHSPPTIDRILIVYILESSMAVAADTIMENAPTMSALVKSAKSTECGPVCYTRAFWSKREATANKFAPLLGNCFLGIATTTTPPEMY